MEICVYFVLGTIFFTLRICNINCHFDESILTLASEATLAEDGKLNFTQLVIKYGQSVEQYDIVTEDGYILTVFRIPGKKVPVLLFHGISDSRDGFVLRGNSSLGITLAKSGYDVWIGNNRGNLYGRHHINMNPDTDKTFWDYSFHEIGYYDLAATIDFIREKTGVESISTISHSQGNSAHFVLTSLRPEYNKRINVCIALAPIAFLDNLDPLVSSLALAGPAILKVLKIAGFEELLQDHTAAYDLKTFICSKGFVGYLICGLGVMSTLFGFDTADVEPDFLTGVLFGHFPRGVSRKCFEHYDQVILRQRFAQYDYGADNLFKYGSVSPPEYNLAKVTMKVALFVANADKLSRVKDVERLRDTLPNVVHYEVMEPPLWGHVDLIVGRDIPKYLLPPILNLLNKYN